MWEFITNVMAMWPLIFADAAIDYATVTFIAPMAGGGNAIGYLVNGLNSTMKAAAAKTTYITGFSLGGMMGATAGAGPVTH